MNKELPLISICILNYNWEERLPKAIPSILSQNYPNLEYLFLDNGSIDKSLDYIKQFKKIEIIQNKINLWTSGWRNILAKKAKWKYLFFIDNDVELVEKIFISIIFNDYWNLKKENIWIIFPIFRLYGDDIYCDTWLYSNKVVKEKFVNVYKKWCIKKPWFPATAFLIEKKTFLELWCFDEKYPYNMDDYDFSMRLYNMWYTIFLDTDLYAIHHWIETRTTVKWIWWRHQYYFCGLMRALIKNYKMKNLIIWSPIIFWRSFIKVTKYSIIYKSFLPLKWFLISIKNFIYDLSDTLKQRRHWQNKRKRKDDYFLQIK